MTYQPKSYRKFLATSVAAAMVATVAAPMVLAAEPTVFTDTESVSSWAGDAINYLVAKDAIEGMGDDKFAPAANLTRAQAATILARTLDLNVDMDAETDFEDTANHWSSPYVKAIQNQLPGVIDGYPNGTFNPEGTISRQEMAKMTVKAYDLKLDANADVSFTDNTGWGKDDIQVLASLGVVEGYDGDVFQPNGKVTRAESVVFVHRAEQDSVRVPVAYNTPEVTSVSANNLRTVTVNFNQAIDTDTLDLAGSDATVKFFLAGSDVAETITNTEYKVSADKKAITVDLGTNAQSTSLKVWVEGVKSVDGVEVVDFVKTLDIVDTTLPTVDGVEVLNSKSLRVNVSEPVQGLSPAGYAARTEIKVDGVSLPVKVTPDYLSNDLIIEFGSSIEVGTHTVAIKGLVDFANFKAPAQEFTFTVEEDVTAPSVVGAKALDKDTVEVTFSEPVASLGTVTVNDVDFNSSSAVWVSTDKTVWRFASTDLFDLGSTVSSTVEYIGTTDVEGNTVKEAVTYEFSAEDDVTKPTVSNVEVKAGNSVKVTFSESLSVTGTVTVLNADGGVVKNKLAVPGLNADKEVSLSASYLGLSANGGTYTLVFAGAKDNSVRTNAMTKYTTIITANDIQKPTATGQFKTAGKVTVAFDEAMNTADLADETSYIVTQAGSDVYLSDITDASVTVAADGKSAVLEFAGASDTSVIKVQDVRDLAGNIVSNFNQNLSITDVSGYSFTEADISTVKAISTTKIQVVLTGNKFGSVDPSTFIVTDGTDQVRVGVSATLNADKTKATITLNAPIEADAEVSNTSLELITAAGNELTTDQYGKYLVITTAEVVNDYITPSLVDTDVPANSTNRFDLVFSEDIAVVTNLDAIENDLIIRKGDGTILANGDYSLSITGTNLEVTIGDNVSDGVETFTVEMPNSRYIKDTTGQDNVASTFGVTSISNVEIDLTGPGAPTITAVDANDTTKVAYTLSGTTEAGSTVAVSIDDETVGGPVTTSVTAAADGTWTATGIDLTSITGVADGDTLTISVTSTDVSGNTGSVATDTVTYDLTAVGATVTPSGGAVNVSIAASGTETFDFGEALNSASQLDVMDAFASNVGGVTATDLSFSWSAAGVLTVTNEHAATAATYTSDFTISDVKDVAGNNTATVNIDVTA